jgi:hypothetical protein
MFAEQVENLENIPEFVIIPHPWSARNKQQTSVPL